MSRNSRLVAAAVCTGLCAAALAGCGSPATAGGSRNSAGPAPAALARSVDQAPAVSAGPVGKNLPDTPTLKAIRKRGYLLYAGARSGIGFSQLDPATQKLSGFDAGIAQLLAKYLLGKPDVKIAGSSSDTREALLQNHAVDAAIETYTITPERAASVDFAGPYYMAASGIVVKAGDNSITSPSDLAGKTVATESGAAEQALKAAVPTAKPVLLDTAAEIVTAVEQGRVQAGALNNALLVGAAITKPDVKMLPVTFGANPFGIGLPKDDPAFKQIVNRFLSTIESDGTWRTLYRNTAGKLLKGKVPSPPAIGSVTGS